jgi:hypothetical protein
LNKAGVELGDVETTGVNTGYGLSIGNIDSGKVTAGNIIVQGNNAKGFVTDDILDGAEITLGDITATGNTLARGVWINGRIDKNADVALGTVHAESNKNAYGINVDGTDAVGDSALTITNDVIAVTNAEPNVGAEVIGIRFIGNENNPNLDLTVNTTNGDVQISGLVTNTTNSGNVTKSIDLIGTDNNDSLRITGTNKHTNKGAEFTVWGAEKVNWTTDAQYVNGSLFATSADTTLQIAAGKTVVIDGYGLIVEDGASYTFGSADDNKSAGSLNVQRLTAGNVTVNNGTLAIDGRMGITGMPSNIGTLTIGNDNPNANESAIVAIYGEAPTGTVALTLNGEPILYDNAVTDLNTNEKVLSLTQFTDYKLTADKTAYVAQRRQQVNLADGFLLPISIHYRLTAWEAVHDHLITNKLPTRNYSLLRGQTKRLGQLRRTCQ